MVVKFEDPDNFLNPIIPGGFPDPSICRVGDVYYICNSSFEYFPGLPIHESTDLVNWRWVGYGLHRKEQVSSAVNLVDVKSEDGIQAPSLRYKDGTFYIITTCVYRPPGTDEGTCTNFIITASDIHGPWSDPHVIEGAPGIDPDIFFDDDGKAWYVGTAAPDKPNYPGEGAPGRTGTDMLPKDTSKQLPRRTLLPCVMLSFWKRPSAFSAYMLCLLN